jgi:hypothetical protein
MKGYSLHIGLNRIDPAHYGSNGQLQGCENDARDMREIAVNTGFKTNMLLTAEATVSNVSNRILEAAHLLDGGDIFFLSYSGHGGQVNDTNGDETDSQDETWCLYDRQLVDDELFSLWANFKPGVRIIVLSDSCHSGTVIKVLEFESILAKAACEAESAAAFSGARTLPQGSLEEVYRHHKDLYDRVQVENPRGNKALVSASVILISGCQDWQLSADGPNGLFTQTLKEVWNGGVFSGNYLDFHQEIWNRMPSYQKPNYYRQGAPNSNFDNQTPFQI